MMKPPMVVCLALLFLPAGVPGQENIPAGIVHGPKAGFNISAPEGWVVDNEAGKGQDLPCVLYPKGSSWSDAKTVMYAKVASPQWEGVNAFVATAIKEMKAKHGMPKEKIASGKTKDGHDYFINEYPATKTYSQWERVGYVQLPQGVGLYRPHIPRSSQLPERFRGTRESSENPGVRRAEVRGGKWPGIRSSLQTAAGSACGGADRAAAHRMAGEGA